MTGSDWPEEFDELLRAYLPLLRDDAPLAQGTPLADLGLDSLSTVGLLVDVEDAFGVQFPDDALVPDTFATASSLWSAVARQRELAEG
ncbi:phosphopantetheine-binding protein [Saccharothrix algeriensis]|uniref:Acyl carrier protein n=1 Tax=Saccharothrix algeriensis TaxID=173560 RepID=A0A8T8HVZ8_9PSEU|nr:phosphopantetheine-binding protein [Saccharothrix algeriensis]MBM7814467.1 acyl carrier protein [Saccharothrix algeriensis]QTR02763.1 acyl carrier protein [Saccharothrix algeriensis]